MLPDMTARLTTQDLMKSIYFLPLLVCACAVTPKYVAPISGPSADISVEEPESFTFVMLNRHGCVGHDRIKRLSRDAAGKTIFKAQAGAPLRLNYQANHGKMACAVAFSFVPSEGKTYQVRGGNSLHQDKDANLLKKMNGTDVAGQCWVQIRDENNQPIAASKIAMQQGFDYLTGKQCWRITEDQAQ